MSTNATTTGKKRGATSNQKENTKVGLKSRNDDCTLVIKEGEVDEIRRLLTMEHVNMIDLQLFSGPNYSEPLLPHSKITFVNADGRALLSWLDIKYFIITWTLSAGRTRYDLHVRESRKGCLQIIKNIRDFVSEKLLQQFIGSTQRTSYGVCYLEANAKEKFTRRCCEIPGDDNSKFECSIDKYRNELLSLILLPNIPLYITYVGFIFVAIFCIAGVFVQNSRTRQNDSTYYYLTESTMSIRSILRYLISDDHGQEVSTIRRFLFVFLISFLYLSHFRQHLTGEQIYMDCIFFYWAISFLFTKILDTVILPNDNHHDDILCLLQGAPFTCLSATMAQYLLHDIRNLDGIHVHSGDNNNDILYLLSLPFNIKIWSATIRKLYNMILENLELLGRRYGFICGCLQKTRVTLLVFTSLICLVYIPCVSVMIIMVIIITIIAYIYRKFKVILRSNSKKQPGCSHDNTFRSLHEVFILILSISFLGIIFLFTWAPFYFGLFVNIMYFIPHITVVCVSTFYFQQIWNSMDSKYFSLKMFIYEEYRERQMNDGHNNNTETPSNNDTEKENGPIVPVVPKELYNQIRERLLPYDTNLWLHAFLLLVLLFFACFFVYILTVLQNYHVTPVVKVLTTMSVSVLPYIFNSLALQTSEEEKRAWNERRKMNVKRVVEELISEDLKFARTVLSIRPHSTRTTRFETSDIEDSNEEHHD
jgi:hypothetical protein